MKSSRSGLSRRDFLGAAACAAGASVAAGAAPETGQQQPEGTLRFEPRVPVADPYDVVVCGGGPSGCAAALAARRAGAKVLLIEGQGQLGGNGTSGLVSHWLGGRTSDCRQWVVGGIFRELSEEAARRGAALIPTPPAGKKYQPHGWYQGQLTAGIPFDPFRVAALLDEKMAESGVDVLLLTQVVDVALDQAQKRITHVVVCNKSGLAAVPARAVVDATGDADLAARSGCKVVKGRDEDGLMTPASLTFHVDHVDQDALSAYIHEHDCPRFRRKIAELRAAGEWTFPYDIFISVQLDEPGTMMINTTRLTGTDGTDARSLSQGMIRGRAEIERLMELMRNHFPGFEQVRLKCVAPALGVRETRRIVGPYVLTVEDLNRGVDFEDTIGFSAYGWDLPDPKRPSHNPAHGRKRPVTPIPFRVMVPQPVENLICPGRAISVERPVLGPLRVMAPCMAMGQAAGTAAAQVAAAGTAFGVLDTNTLRNRLTENGAIVIL
jgi:hypothetical protein